MCELAALIISIPVSASSELPAQEVISFTGASNFSSDTFRGRKDGGLFAGYGGASSITSLTELPAAAAFLHK
ncbi:hypothetical protein J6590_062184 [Homalodisca vitripennis]|nr:hypothetical protein J6590_088433 [Homalodisca vitripennis]KAG8281268.1 hypothetical protein J6590_062184 [Homalodisca vitripennis]